MKIPKSWVNRLVECCFYDHSENTEEMPVLVVRGRIETVGRKYLHIITTECLNADDLDNAVSAIRVVRSAIQSIALLERVQKVFEDTA